MKIKLTTGTSGKCRLYLLVLMCLYSGVSYSQFEVGLGLFSGYHIFNYPDDRIELPDDVIITIRENAPCISIFDDPNTSIFMSYRFNKINKKNIFHYSVDFIYFRKYESMFVGYSIPGSGGRGPSKGSHIASSTLQFFGNVGLNPLSDRIKIMVGLGPSFYFNNKPDQIHFIDAPGLDEPFYKSQMIHRNLSINYSIRALWELTNRFGVSLLTQGNITSINKPINISGTNYDVNTTWRYLMFIITYSFDVDLQQKSGQ